MSHIFISYSRKDINSAQRIVDALAADNLDIWIDWKSIPKGEDWEQEIYQGIEEADAFLFLISPDSVTSEMCNKEIAHAVKNGKRILPIVIRDADLKYIDREIRKRNWIFIHVGQDDFNEGIAQICKTIRTDYVWLEYHTELHKKALTWKRRTESKDTSRLLRGKELKEAEKQIYHAGKDKDPQPTNEQINYINASKDFRRRMLMAYIAISIASLLVFLFLYVRYYNESSRADLEAAQRSAAELAESEARAVQAAVQAENLVLGSGDVVEAARLILKSDQIVSSSGSKRATYLLSMLPMPDKILADPGYEISDAGFNNQKELILTVGTDSGHAIIWNAQNGDAIYSLPLSHISSANFTPDGNSIITTDWGDRIRIWNADNGVQSDSINGYGGLLGELNFSQIYPSIIYACEGRFVCLFDYEKGEQLSKLDSQLESVGIAGFSYDNRSVVAYGDNQIHILDISTGEVIRSIASGECEDLTISLHEYLMACATYKGKITIWDYMTGEQKYLYENSGLKNDGQGLARGRLSVLFDPGGKTVALNTLYGEAVVFDINQGGSTKLIAQDIVSLQFSPDGETIVTGHLDGTARIWDVESGKELIRLQRHRDIVLSARFIHDDDTIVTTSVDGTARMWDLKPLNLVQHISTAGLISQSRFSHNAETMALVMSSNSILIWDVKNDSNLFVLQGHADDIESIQFSFDDKYLVSASRDGTFCIWDLTNGNLMKTISGHDGEDILSAAFSPDGKKVASAGLNGDVCLWDAKTGDLIHKFVGHKSGVFDVSFNDAGTQLLTIDYWGVIGQWDVKKEELIRFHEMEAQGLDSGFTVGYTSATFNRNGSLIAAVGKDEIARIWDSDSGDQVAMFWEHPDITSVVFNPSGDKLISYGNDNVIRLWDISSGTLEAELVGHGGESDSTISDGILSVQFNQSGDEIISIGVDDTLRVWDLKTGENIATLPISTTYSASVSDTGSKIGAYDSFGNFNILNIDYIGLVEEIKLRLQNLGIEDLQINK